MSVRKFIKCWLSSIYRVDRADERGLSTLEWILLVAAVGGLATIGVIVVRGAVDETDDRTQSQTELAGEAGAMRRLQGEVTQVMLRLRAMSNHGTDPDRFNVCLGNEDAIGNNDQLILYRQSMKSLQEKHSELYSFHPVSVDISIARKFPIAWRGDWVVVWCRVRHKASGVCTSIADETPVSDPPNDGYRDTNMYRTGRYNKTAPGNTRHNYPLSHTFCKGRV